ncbi:hypothetical protein K9L67_00195 [Candidatus Woesearchaeota archaeon]|nr:hypothetical protein [Candidatus Woesearchaeota archaeon]MCF7900626.1 hypothetical protein [Candidatus Woesearchaeota archaeon]MCF8013466.1 hypothetical protein [Candidatus Woesearchaeota archaeon]
MGLFGLGKKKEEKEAPQIEKVQLPGNSKVGTTTVQEENASFQVPDFSEDDLDFDLDVNEFLPELKSENSQSEEKQQGMSMREQMELQKSLNPTTQNENQEEPKNINLKVNTIKIDQQNQGNQQNSTQPTFNQPEIKQPNIERKPIMQPTFNQPNIKKSNSLPTKLNEDIEKIQQQDTSFQENNLDENSNDFSTPNFDEELNFPDENQSPESESFEENPQTKQDLDLEEKIFSENKEPDKTNETDLPKFEIKPKQSTTNQQKEFIEKEDYKKFLVREDEIKEESRDNKKLTETILKHHDEQQILYEYTEKIIEDIKTRLLELDERIFEINQNY